MRASFCDYHSGLSTDETVLIVLPGLMTVYYISNNLKDPEGSISTEKFSMHYLFDFLH